LGESPQSGRRSQGCCDQVGKDPAKRAPAPSSRGAGSEGLDFAGVIACYQTPLLRYAGHMVERTEDAQDIVQETFLRYCRCIREHGRSSVRALSTWLFRVAHNLAQDALRRRQRERKARAEVGNRPVSEGEAAAIEGMVRQAACERAMAELSRLPESHRHVLLLKIIQDMTLREIAKVTGLSPGNVAYRISQGLKEIARRLKEAEVI